MKLATLNDGTRDGQLAVVARDLKTAHLADGIAPTLQAALDDWAFIGPQLRELYQMLNGGRAKRTFDFDPAACLAPLPRVFQRAGASAYARHDGDADRPDAPTMYQCAGDALQAAHEEIVLAHEEWGIDFGAEVAVLTDDVPLGATADQAHGQIRLLMLMNDVTLHNLGKAELAGGHGFVQAKASAACSPVAVTPDELGEHWQDGKVNLAVRATWNGKLVGQPLAGEDMLFNFPQLLAHLCRTRALRAGTLVGGGAVASLDEKKGYACIADRRSREMRADGIASTPFMLFGDTIRIEMLDSHGKSVFGAIEQTLRQAEARKLR